MIEFHSSCSKVSDTKICPKCKSSKIIKNGHTKTQKQQYFCKECKKRFLEYYTYKAYLPMINKLIVQLIKEGLGIRSISRVLQISPTTLLRRIITISKSIKPPKLSFGKSYEMDEMCFYVGNKTKKFWLAYAIERETGQVVGFQIGKRTNKTLNFVLKTLKNANPNRIFTDKLRNYSYLISKEIHFTNVYKTNKIERKNLSIRTDLKRFQRRTICFSRSIFITNSILQIYFFCSFSTL